jgi:hypothetical protein
MRDFILRRVGLCSFAALCFVSTAPTQAITLSPGTVLGGDSVAPGGTTLTLVQYSQSTGAIVDSLVLNTTAVPTFGTLGGLAVVGSHVYIAGSNGDIAEVNLSSGALIGPGISTGLPAEGLGNIGNDLLIAASNGSVRRYTISGSLVGSITLAGGSGLRGIDSDGTQIFAAWNTGQIRKFDLSGNLLSSTSTDISGAAMSGLGYDFATGHLWISTGFGSDEIREYTQAGGSPVNSFTAGYPFINGLDVVPEPAMLILFPLALLPLWGSRGRRCTQGPAD